MNMVHNAIHACFQLKEKIIDKKIVVLNEIEKIDS